MAKTRSRVALVVIAAAAAAVFAVFALPRPDPRADDQSEQTNLRASQRRVAPDVGDNETTARSNQPIARPIGYELSPGLARFVSHTLNRELGREDFATGSELFDGEWLFGTYMMAALGFGQLALLESDVRDTWRREMEDALSLMLSDRAREFDAAQWGEDPSALDSLSGDHAAYLGYANLALSLYRRIFPTEGRADLLQANEDISAWLAARLRANRGDLLASYPGEWYPVDNCAVVASLRLFGDDQIWPAAEADRWLVRLDTTWRDPGSDLLWQAYDPNRAAPSGAPRGSGTALCAYFLSFAYPRMSRDLFTAIRWSLVINAFGLSAVREYPDGWDVREDIDSGPIVMGFGVSATGFTLALAQIHGDDELARDIVELSRQAGGFQSLGPGIARYEEGTPVHNAIMLAMLSAHRIR